MVTFCSFLHSKKTFVVNYVCSFLYSKKTFVVNYVDKYRGLKVCRVGEHALKSSRMEWDAQYMVGMMTIKHKHIYSDSSVPRTS